MTLDRARLRTVYKGRVVELDVIKCTACDWASAIEEDPSLAAWWAVAFDDGMIIALEPIAGAAARFCAACPGSVMLPGDRREVSILAGMVPRLN